MPTKSTMDEIINFLKDENVDIDPFNDNYTSVDPDTDDIEDMEGNWAFPAIYKKDSHGNSIKWQIGFNDTTKKLLTVVGRVETGGMQIFPVDVMPNKLSKSYNTKAFKEAKTKFENKLKEGYKYESGEGLTEIPQPMLANKYVPPTEKSVGNVPHFPVAAQCKFDGIRNIVYIDGKGDTIMLSRKMNRRMYFTNVREESTRLLTFLPRGTILDGELYSQKVDFETIGSIGGSELVQHPEEDKLDYNVFDIFHADTVWKKGMKVPAGIMDDAAYMRASGYMVQDGGDLTNYIELGNGDIPELGTGRCRPVDDIANVPLWTLEVRLGLMVNAFECYRQKYDSYPTYLKLVKTYIIRKREEIEQIFAKFRAEKFEGAMLRHFSRGNADPLLSLYRPGRSNNLLKVKDREETEVKIIGVTAGRGKDKDLAIFLYQEVDTGYKGSVRPKMTDIQRRHYLKNPKEVIGRTYTISFQNRTRDGKLRFPVGVAFRDAD